MGADVVKVEGKGITIKYHLNDATEVIGIMDIIGIIGTKVLKGVGANDVQKIVRSYVGCGYIDFMNKSLQDSIDSGFHALKGSYDVQHIKKNLTRSISLLQDYINQLG